MTEKATGPLGPPNYERQVSDALRAKAVFVWQQMDPSKYLGHISPEDVDDEWQYLVGSQAREFKTELEGAENVEAALIFWAEGGHEEFLRKEEGNKVFTIIFDEPTNTKLVEDGKKLVVATSVSVTDKGTVFVEEHTMDEPFDVLKGETYNEYRDFTPDDVVRAIQVLDNAENGDINPMAPGSLGPLYCYGPHALDIWEEKARPQ